MTRFSFRRAAVLIILAVAGAHAASADTSLLTSRPLPKQPEAKAAAVGDEIRAKEEPRRVLLPDGSRMYVNRDTRVKLLDDKVLSLESGEVFLEVEPWPGKAGTPWKVRTAKREVTAPVTKDSPRVAVRVEDDSASVLVARGSVEVAGLKQPLRAGQQLAAGKDEPSAAARVSHRLAWAGPLMSAGAALVPPSEYAGGSLVAVDPDGQEAKLQMRKFHIDVLIEDGFARTTIDQTYFNQTDGRLEGTFYFPLPPDASLTQLEMYVNGERMDGGMVERDYGRTVYESIVTRQKDPALLEWVDGSTFKMRVFPLEPRQEKRIILSYTQQLPSPYGQVTYRFPSAGGQAVREWSFLAQVGRGTEMVWNCSSHTLEAEKKDTSVLALRASEKDVKATRDIVLTLTPKGAARSEPHFSSFELDGARYLMVRYRPDLPPVKVRERRDWVFLVECSADRDPLLMRTQIEIVRGLLQSAEPDDTVTLLTVNNRTYDLIDNIYGARVGIDELGVPKTYVPQTGQGTTILREVSTEAVNSLEKQHIIGALDLGQGLAKAEPHLSKAKNPYLVHIGSGVAAMGERGPALLKRIPDKVKYVGVGVGKRWDRAFMKNAADKTGGYFTQINPDEPIAWRAFELAATLNTPRLMDAGIHPGADGPGWRLTTTSIAQGEELCAVARFEGEEKFPKVVVVRGVLDGKPYSRDLPVKDVAKDAGYLPRTWAKLEIDRLLADDPAKHKDAIVALSKAMYVMTPFTSLLVLENEEMYQQYKVERGRKDRWALYASPKTIPVVYEPVDGEKGDPKKGVKPSAKNVAKTIVTRGSPRLLVWSGEPRIEQKKGMPQTLDIQEQVLDVGQVARPFPALPAPPPSMYLARSSLEFGAPTLSKLPKMDGFESPPTANDPDAAQYALEVWRRREKLSPNNKDQLEDYFLNSQRDLDSFGPSHLTPERTHGGIRDGMSHAGKIMEVERIIFPDIIGTVPLYTRPRYSGSAELFADLVAFAPGLNTTAADGRALLEAEAALRNNKPGTIDDGARALFAKARLAGPHTLTVPADGLQPAYTIAFDDKGRFEYERTLPIGMREQVICDGKTILHLYPDLGLAARRTVSRFHRLDVARLVPQALASPEDYARGADLRLVDERTVAVMPHGADEVRDADGKPVPYVRVHLVFGDKGPLVERRYVEMPSKKVVAVEKFDEAGGVKYLDEKGKETSARKSELDKVKVQPLKPDLKQFVVLPLPYRTPEHVVKTLGIEKKGYGDIRFEEGHALLAAFFATGDSGNAAKVFQQCFHDRDQRQIGYYVLLAACGHNLDGDHFDLLTEYPNSPLAQYLALHSSPVLRKHATQWAIASSPFGDGWLNRLATAHALYQRWEGRGGPKRTEAQQKAEREKALQFIEQNKGSGLAWALLGLVHERVAAEDDGKKDLKEIWAALAEAYFWFADTPALEYYARYEMARCLWKAGERDEARAKFRTLYEETLEFKGLPPIDADFRQALLGTGDEENLWKRLMPRATKFLLKRKDRAAVVAVAAQCGNVGDQTMANDLLEMTLDSVKGEKEFLPLAQAVVEVLIRNGQLETADRKVQELLRDKALETQPALHRLAMRIAESRDQPARQMRELERVLDLEFQNLPDEIDLRQVRREYGELLRHYQRLAEAWENSQPLSAPHDFYIRVMRVADRWRALDPTATEPCILAARVLRTHGQRDSAWDYLTTPVALRPNEAQPWHDLAATLVRQGDLELADRAYEAAFDAEPTNAQILWDRAQNLRQMDRTKEAQALLKKLAEEKWQPRFNWIQQQAKWQLEKR
jgi:tetratricopeptide (TPR) repeat protein